MSAVATDSKLPDALNRLTVIEVARSAGIDLKVGAQKSPFREDRKPSFSVLRNGQGWKDHATGEHGSVWAFTRLLRPQESVAETARFLIGLAGLADAADGAAPAATARPMVKPVRRKFEHSEEWPATVQFRWMEGIGAITEAAVGRLAARRGWPDDFVHQLIGLDLLSYPLLPWHDYHEERGRRGWAFKVERMMPLASGQIERVPVGYHQTFEIPQPDGKARKSWVYVPYVPNAPAEGRSWSVFQERLAALEQRVAPYPFYVGARTPRHLTIFEGQWDAATFHAVAQSDGSCAMVEEGAVLGLRGNQSVDTTMECLADFLRKHRPVVDLWPDNDEAGSTWTRSEIGKAPCFRDRLLAAGAREVNVFRVQPAKDLNDLYRLRKFTREELAYMSIVALGNGGKVVLP